MISAPSSSAITVSPGMPRLMVGMKSPCTEECVEASGQATPSIAPRPKRSGVFDIFWGLIASFWIGNILLVILNVPMIGLWVKLLSIPYRYLYPSAMFFVCIGVYAANNDMFQVGETRFIGVVGYILLRLDFHPAPILLGFVLGPRFEENFRRSLLISRGDLMTFIERPISAYFLLICIVLIVAQIYVWLRKPKIIAEEQAIEAQVPTSSYSELA